MAGADSGRQRPRLGCASDDVGGAFEGLATEQQPQGRFSEFGDVEDKPAPPVRVAVLLAVIPAQPLNHRPDGLLGVGVEGVVGCIEVPAQSVHWQGGLVDRMAHGAGQVVRWPSSHHP